MKLSTKDGLVFAGWVQLDEFSYIPIFVKVGTPVQNLRKLDGFLTMEDYHARPK